MHFHVVHVKVRGNSRKISNFRICKSSTSKMGSLWPNGASTGVRILPISMSFFHFFHLIWLALTKLEVNLAIETHNSIFLKILTVWLIPLCNCICWNVTESMFWCNWIWNVFLIFWPSRSQIFLRTKSIWSFISKELIVRQGHTAKQIMENSFFYIFRIENQSNFFQSGKGNGQIVLWIMFYKMFTEYIFLFYHFQCHCRNVVQGIGRNQEEFFSKKKEK